MIYNQKTFVSAKCDPSVQNQQKTKTEFFICAERGEDGL